MLLSGRIMYYRLLTFTDPFTHTIHVTLKYRFSEILLKNYILLGKLVSCVYTVVTLMMKFIIPLLYRLYGSSFYLWTLSKSIDRITIFEEKQKNKASFREIETTKSKTCYSPNLI